MFRREKGRNVTEFFFPVEKKITERKKDGLIFSFNVINQTLLLCQKYRIYMEIKNVVLLAAANGNGIF